MPHESDPSYASWQPALDKILQTLQDGAILVAHSVGATILIKRLVERNMFGKLAGIFLIAAPFVGAGGWPADEIEFSADLGARLPQGVPIHFYHGLADEIVPPSHVDLYARVIPQASVHRLTGRDHQLNNDLSDIAVAILRLVTSPRELPGSA